MKSKIGESIIITEGFSTETSNGPINIKKGDKGFIDSRGCIHYISGEARGKIQKAEGEIIEGYDNTNIAKMIFKALDTQYDLKTCLDENYNEDESNFIDVIEDTLNIIL